jgi:hypothetical protein
MKNSKIMTITGYNNIILSKIRPEFSILSPNEGIQHVLIMFLVNFAYFHSEFSKEDFKNYLLSFEGLIDDQHDQIEPNQDWYDKYSVMIPKELLINSIRKFCLNITENNLFLLINNYIKSELKPPRNCEIKTIM